MKKKPTPAKRSRLKPCPFCGARLRAIHLNEGGWVLRCTSPNRQPNERPCLLWSGTDERPTRKELILAANRRAKGRKGNG